MRHPHSRDDLALLTSTVQCFKLNDLARLKALDKEWIRNWKTLTSNIDRTAPGPIQSIHTTWQNPRSLPMWALIDVAHETNHLTERNASQCILDLVSRTPPPHESLRTGEFRLLKIHDGKGDDVLECKIFNTPLQEVAVQYFALSYCWGSSTQPQKVIFLNGRATVVRENLFICLNQFRQVRHLASVCHWVDALCIRQDDVQEKNSQLPLMGRIYSAARSVNIWLGPEEDDSGYVLDTMYESEVDAMQDMRFIKAFEHLLRRPWFGRLWVIQELVLASQTHPPLIWSGCHSSTWQALSHLHERLIDEWEGHIARAIQGLNPMHGIADQQLPRGYQDQREVATIISTRIAWAQVMLRLSLAIRDCPISALTQQRDFGNLEQYLFRATSSLPTQNSAAQQLIHQSLESMFLVSLWISARAFKASNPRDHIYGVLGMRSGLRHTDLTIDYGKSVREVYFDATVTIFHGGNAAALHCILYAFPTFSTNISPDNHRVGPSWVFDFSYRGADWAESLISKEDWVNQSRYAASYAVGQHAFQVHLPARQLVVHVSTVDEIVWLTDMPQVRYEVPCSVTRLDEIQAFFDFLLAAHSIYSANQDVHVPWRQQSLFECTLEMPQATKRSKTLFEPLSSTNFDRLLDQARDLGKFPDRSALNSLYRAMMPFSSELKSVLETHYVLQPRISFFVTVQGLCGLCMPGAQIGDQVVILFRDAPGWMEVPYVVRSNGDETHSMVSVAWVPKSWKDLCKHNGTLEPRWMTFT